MTRIHGSILWNLLFISLVWHCFVFIDVNAFENDASPLGINLSRVCYWSTEFPFKDLFKQSQPWQSQAKGKPYGQGPSLVLSPLGWVQWFRPGQTADTLITRTAGEYPPEAYICRYNGNGTLRPGNDAREIHRSPGEIRMMVHPSSRGITLTLEKTDDLDPIKNIQFIPNSMENTSITEPFHPRFLKNWAPFKVIRFMDWMGTNDSPLQRWSQRTLPAMQTQAEDAGVALEYMILLANTLHADPWFCMPHRADDTYIENFARMVKETLNPDLKIYIEYTNEAWNEQFSQARYCREKGLALGLNYDPVKARIYYYTGRALDIFSIWERQFKGTDRLVRVLASQFTNPWTSRQILEYLDAGHRVDALAIAPYFGKALGGPEKTQTTLQMTREQLFDACEKEIESNHAVVATHARMAATYGLELLAYEGGQHLVGTRGAQNNETVTSLFHTMNRDPRMKALYLKDLQGWSQAGGSLFVTFASTGPYNKWGSWGVLEHAFQDPETAPKYQAVTEYIKRFQKPSPPAQ